MMEVASQILQAPKEYWLNIYGPPYKDDQFWHPSRPSAEASKMKARKLLYRIHVRLK